MKKSLLILGALAAMSMVFMGCPNNSTSDPTEAVEFKVGDVTSITLEKNSTYNNQGVVTWLASDNERVFKTGDKLKFTIVATADASVGELKGFLIDNSAAANYWNMLSGYVESGTNISTDSTTYTFEFTFTADSSSKDPAACKLGLYFEPVQDESVTLTVTSFEVE